MPMPAGNPSDVRTYEKNAPASSTYGVKAVNPTAKNSKMTVETTNVAGKPAPLPAAMPSGTTPPITPSGAAAATTMSTIEATPRLPRSLRTGPGGSSLKASGAAMISDMGEPSFDGESVGYGYRRTERRYKRTSEVIVSLTRRQPLSRRVPPRCAARRTRVSGEARQRRPFRGAD